MYFNYKDKIMIFIGSLLFRSVCLNVRDNVLEKRLNKNGEESSEGDFWV